MNNIIKTIAIATIALSSVQAFAQEHGRGDTVLTRAAFHDGVTTVDSLNIDTDISVNGGVYMQRGATGNIATVTLNTLDAAAVELTQKVRIKGDTNLGDEANLSEANVYLTGDMGAIDINTQYKREGKVALGPRSSLNMGNVMVKK